MVHRRWNMVCEMADSSGVARAIQLVNEMLASEFELEAAAIVPAARMREDLGLDSLDAVDLIGAIEKALHIRVPEELAREMRTVGDVHAYVRNVSQ